MEHTAADQGTVFVVDDDPAMRQSLRWLLESVGLAVETYSSAEEFLRACDRERSGCLVLDVRMPGMGGLGLQDELAARDVLLPVILITAYAEVPMAVRAMKAGAMEFLEKPFSPQLLIDRVRQAMELDGLNRLEQERQNEIERRIERLSPRQRQVMELVAAGKSNKVIADTLGIREKTVEVHRGQLMHRLKAENVAALIRLVGESRRVKGKPLDIYRKVPS